MLTTAWEYEFLDRENDLLNNFETYSDHFEHIKHHVYQKMNEYIPHSNVLEEIQENMTQLNENSFDNLDTTTRQKKC